MTTGCRDECGAQSEAPANEGWYFLEAQREYRCPKCAKELKKVNSSEKKPSDNNPPPG